MKQVMRNALTSVGLLWSTAPWANYSCTGPVDWVALNQAGIVTVSSTASGLGVFYVCQIGATTNNIGPAVCNAMFAQLTAARATGNPVQWSFDDSLTCTTHPTWTWLSGWYYGPQA